MSVRTAQGRLDPGAEPPMEEQIRALRHRERTEQLLSDRLEAMYEQIADWVGKGHTGTVIHQMLRERIPCSPTRSTPASWIDPASRVLALSGCHVDYYP